jgi:hypothetical protein
LEEIGGQDFAGVWKRNFRDIFGWTGISHFRKSFSIRHPRENGNPEEARMTEKNEFLGIITSNR